LERLRVLPIFCASEIGCKKAHTVLQLLGLAGKFLGRGRNLFSRRSVLLHDLIELGNGLVDLIGAGCLFF